FKLKKREYNSFVYTRPPYSLVGDGFFCIGDSAANTHPIETRGIQDTWLICHNTVDVFDNALKKEGYITRDIIWDVNVRHFRDAGAENAYLYMIASILHKLSEKEVEFLLKKLRSIVDPQNDYKDSVVSDTSDVLNSSESSEISLSIGTIFKVVFEVIFGIFSGKVAIKRIFQLLKINKKASQIKKHYKKFPENPNGFNKWVEEADEIWNTREHITKIYRTTTAICP
ncbi:MAG: hypothetical protein GY870_21825, partial [archaeon]|nr:hypothetical protein [archaeon]